MHDGTNTYEGVLDVVTRLKDAGKDLVILSNSSKRQENSIKMLKKLGFDPSDFSQIITSGEVAYHMLSKTSPESSPLAPQPWDVLEESAHEKTTSSEQRKVFCFGSGDEDEAYLNSCGWTLSSMEKADLIVARGTFTINDGTSVVDKNHDGEDAYFSTYHEQMEIAAQRKLPMIVANPDKIRPDADRSPMPGTIGHAYEMALLCGDTGLVKYIGKPFSDVYEIALRNKDRSRACMIGDALETDVAGGSVEGIDTIWVVNDGIHNAEIQNKGNGSLQKGCASVLEEFNKLEGTYAKGRQLSPTVVLPHFRW
jgi:HAD superfamily hydrolase (TIGR01450 family)